MLDDDRQVGRILSRREVLARVGATGTALLAAQSARSAAAGEPAGATAERRACVATPEQTEGPYFADDRLERADIRTDPADGAARPGVPLHLTLRVFDIGRNRCERAARAVVDLWQCDALGLYSSVRDINGLFDTSGKKFLRGYQRTGDDGTVRFVTIYPGWYPGRTVHVHFKIRTEAASGQGYELTSQLYFDDALTDRVHALAPYATHGRRTVTNARDGIFRNGGDLLTLALRPRDEGYETAFDVGLYTAGRR
jgi:protocatechuate 3,4-dioxygenase beta subunit